MIWAARFGFLIGLIATLVACFPASVLINYLAPDSKNNGVVVRATGSVWSGEVSLQPRLSTAAHRHPINQQISLGWRAIPSLTPLGVRVDWIVPMAMASHSTAMIEFKNGSVTATQQSAAINLAGDLLFGYLPELSNVVHIKDIFLRIDSVSIKDFSLVTVDGSASLRVSGVSSPLAQLEWLGDYRLEASVSDAKMQFLLSTGAGVLRAEGGGQFQDRVLKMAVDFSAEPAQLEKVDHLLNLLGRRDGPNSKYHIALRL